MSSISMSYNVPMESIKEYNGLVNDTVRFGQKLTIPLCRRNATAGPSPTPTPPPPYPAPNLLLPADGAPFTLADDTVTLQWASVGVLRENEAYAVTVEDVTEGQGRKIVEYVTDTKLIVPSTFRPNDRHPACDPLVGIDSASGQYRRRRQSGAGTGRRHQPTARFHLDRLGCGCYPPHPEIKNAGGAMVKRKP